MAEQRGDLTCFKDVEVMCGVLMMKLNQLEVQHGTTAFERTYAQPPRTPLMEDDTLPAMPMQLAAPDARMCRMMKAHVKEMMMTYFAARETVSRSNQLHKLGASAKSKTEYRDLRPGDTISYRGERYSIMGRQ